MEVSRNTRDYEDDIEAYADACEEIQMRYIGYQMPDHIHLQFMRLNLDYDYHVVYAIMHDIACPSIALNDFHPDVDDLEAIKATYGLHVRAETKRGLEEKMQYNNRDAMSKPPKPSITNPNNT